jgi:enterochelin esterase-like enzyme
MNIKYLFLFCLFTIVCSCNRETENMAIPNVAAGELVRIDGFKSKFVKSKNIDIWLPPSYNKSNHLGVLYMHDGQSLFDASITWNNQEWGIDEFFTNHPELQNYIVVGIWNAGDERWTEYFPQKSLDYMSDQSIKKLQNWGGNELIENLSADQYLKFIVQDLKPYIDSSFNVDGDKSSTAIMGSSMGGLISWYAVLEYPDVFGTAICLSTHWPGVFTNEDNPIPPSFKAYIKDHLSDLDGNRFYFDTGTRELDSLYLVHQVEVDSLFLLAGYKDSDFQSRIFEGAGHNENYWRSRLEFPLKFLAKE